MIISMYKRICVTNRHLVKGDFFEQIGQLVSSKNPPDIIVLREKDLKTCEYLEYATKLSNMDLANTSLYIHNHIEVAKSLNIRNIHLSFSKFMEIKDLKSLRPYFDNIGTSIHSLEDIRLCNEAGFDYVFAGHIFETDCKKGLKGRGLDFLKEIVDNASMPVYAIGGIKRSNEEECIKAGALGVCKMSEYMLQKLI